MRSRWVWSSIKDAWTAIVLLRTMSEPTRGALSCDVSAVSEHNFSSEWDFPKRFMGTQATKPRLH